MKSQKSAQKCQSTCTLS